MTTDRLTKHIFQRFERMYVYDSNSNRQEINVVNKV